MNLCDGTTIELPFPTGITLVMDPPSSTLIVVPVEGIEGPPGPTPVVLTYALVAASSFSQVHPFGYLPEVLVVEGTAEILADVTYPDANHVYISFSTPFTGTVVLR